MKITIIHGQSHKGSTYHISRMLAERIAGESGEITEFFMPRDLNQFCVGCCKCFIENESACPHYEQVAPITRALDEADVLIFGSPVYAMRAAAPMKNFLDHHAWSFMIHRPEACMFSKQAVAIATAAGGGIRSTCKDMLSSFFHWGVARRYRYGKAVAAASWENVSDKKKVKIESDIDRLAKKIRARYGHVRPGFATRAYFRIVAKIQRNGWNAADKEYWIENGWTSGKHPW